MAEGDTIVVRGGHQVLGPLAVLTGDETATGTLYVGDEDPAVDHLADLIPGDEWRVPTGTEPPYETKVRNAANDGWVPDYLVSTNGAGSVVASALVNADGNASLSASNAVGVAGSASVAVSASDDYANLTATATSGAVGPVGIEVEIEEGAGVLTIRDGTGATGAVGDALVPNGSGAVLWAPLPYDNGLSGLSANYMQGAMDEVALRQAANVMALALTVSDPPTQVEVQSIADKLDALLLALKNSDAMVPD